MIYKTSAYIEPDSVPYMLYFNRTLPAALDGAIWYTKNAMRQMKASFYTKAYGAAELKSDIIIDICDPLAMFLDPTSNPVASIQLYKGDTSNSFMLNSADFKLAPAVGADFCATTVSLENQNGTPFTGQGITVTSGNVTSGKLVVDTSVPIHNTVYLTARKGTNVVRRAMVTINVCAPILTGTPIDRLEADSSSPI